MASHHILIFPRAEAGIMIPFEAATALNPVTAISLPMIMTTIHDSIRPIPTRQMRAEDINNLSAKGSRSSPRAVVLSVLRAKTPSAISVRAAKPNTANEMSSLPSKWDKRRNTSKGMQRIRNNVRTTGIFMLSWHNHNAKDFQLQWRRNRENPGVLKA